MPLLRTLFAPLVSLFIYLLGVGFYSTLLALKMALNHASTLLIGAITGVFYAGLVLGSLRADRYIFRVGHIRAYVVFSFVLALTCLVQGFFYHPGLWLLLRFIGGFATAGLFVVIESWLLSLSTPVNRGLIMSLYMISFYGAQSIGQFFLNLGDPQKLFLFALTASLCMLSAIPLVFSTLTPARYSTQEIPSFSYLFNKSTAGMLGSLSSGMIMGGIFGLMALYLSGLGANKAEIANYMFIIIFGGMLGQYPLGKLSDRMERRIVLIFICGAAVLISLAIIWVAQLSPMLLALMLLFGALTFTLYPVSVSHACDAMHEQEIVSGTQGLLLSYSVGATIGPFIAPLLMQTMGKSGLFVYFTLVCGFALLVFIASKLSAVELPTGLAEK